MTCQNIKDINDQINDQPAADYLKLSGADLEKLIVSQATDASVRIRLLKLAVKHAITNPTILRLAKQGEGYDLMGYHDAFHYLAQALDNHLILNVDQPPSDFNIGSTVVHDVWQNGLLKPSFEDRVCVHHSHIILNMVLEKNSYATVKRLLGFHQLSTHQALWDGQRLVVSLPFEYHVFLHKDHLKVFGDSVKPEWLFYLEPNNQAFGHHLSPAPVAGVTVAGENYTHGFVTHPNILASYMDENDDWKDHRFSGTNKDDYATALAFDSTLSLKILKYRYGLPIAPSQIERHENIDNELYETMKKEGHVILEY